MSRCQRVPKSSAHALDAGEHHQHVRVDGAGECGGGAILVDHRLRTLEPLVPPHDRDPTAARGNYEHPGARQGGDRLELDDLPRPGAGHDRAPAAAGVRAPR